VNAILVFSLLTFRFLPVQAQEISVLEGSNPSQKVSLQQIAQQIHPGQVVLMGENHGLKTAQQAQQELLDALRDAGLKVSVGLEFFEYPTEPLVMAFRQGRLSEADFLKQIQWGRPSFDFYRKQALFPRLEEGSQTLAINAPRSLTGKIATQGLSSLTPAEKALLPPSFQLGRESYRKRFLLAVAPHLPTPEAGENYFVAQSTWDDTMAWKAAEFLTAHPDQVLVIVVGDFHVKYKDGLPARVQARTGKTPLVFSYVNGAGLSPAELQAELLPSATDGPRADFLWLAFEALENRFWLRSALP
jgi:uncharacterized iron-regulated protein